MTASSRKVAARAALEHMRKEPTAAVAAQGRCARFLPKAEGLSRPDPQQQFDPHSGF